MMAIALPTAAAGSSSTPDFADLVEAHQGMVFSIAYHFLHDRAIAEEIAQDVFLRLYSKFGKIKSADHAVFWLRRTAVNRCIDHARRMRRRPEIAIESLPDFAVPALETDEWINRRLRRLVASLPEEARMIVVLRYQEDLGPKEIAALLQISVNTVKSRLQRSLALLRDKAGVK